MQATTVAGFTIAREPDQSVQTWRSAIQKARSKDPEHQFEKQACIALYAEALLRGYVARVILLFYLTPVWSTLLGRALLGDRITRVRATTIALGLIGLFVVFGIGTGPAARPRFALHVNPVILPCELSSLPPPPADRPEEGTLLLLKRAASPFLFVVPLSLVRNREKQQGPFMTQ